MLRNVRGQKMRTAVIAAVALLLGLASSAPALGDGPAWQVNSLSNTTVAPGDTIDYVVQMVNVGNAATDGSQVTLTATLPPGMTAVDAVNNGFTTNFTCTGPGGSPIAGASVVVCTDTPVIPGSTQFDWGKVMITAAADPAASGVLTSSFQVSGGGAPDASTVDPTHVTTSAPSFGVEAFDAQVAADAAGDPFTQAGGHPFDATTSVDFDTTTNPNPLIGILWPVEPTKDVQVDLPSGFVVNPTVAAQCSPADLAHSEGVEVKALCPPASQVGVVTLRYNFPFGSMISGPLPVYNLVPRPNVPAELGFNVSGTVVTLDGVVRSGSDYGLTANFSDISEGLDIAKTTLTLWGVPSDPSHDDLRACPGQLAPWEGGGRCESGAPHQALLRNPTSCTPAGVGLPTTLHMDSWAHPGASVTKTIMSHDPPGYPAAPSDWGPQQGPTGCDTVPFEPSLTAVPVSPAKAGEPDGFGFDLNLPQTTDPVGIAESDLKKAVVTLPQGVHVAAGAADGLGGCSPARISLHSADDPTCPDSSEVGSLTIKTPLLDQELTGSIYLATPHDNPFNSLIAIYLVAKAAGVVVKLPGEVNADPNTGQLTATFDNNPQLPFSNLHLEFDGGPRASLVLPKECGTYTTKALLYPWARPDTPVESDSTFTVSADGNGAPCPPQGFSPGFVAGTENPIAGVSSPFLMRLTRGDDDQELSTLAVDTPLGFKGSAAGPILCSDADANAGTCPGGSRVGSVVVGAGAGPSPFYITTGRAYFTGPYKGAPFGLSIVVPAVAGPFDLGNVVVRAKVEVDRRTAQLKVVSNPLPTILQGIPLDVRDVRVAIDRPGFILNPTSCSPKNVRATVGSTQGAIAHVASHFQVTDCAELPLTPKLRIAVGSRGHTSPGHSTSLTATLTLPREDAGLRVTSVVLPGTLNARLPVINRACTLAQFNAGRCGNGAKAGTAVAVTPLLRDPLRGSVYFVKNPARVLPDMMVALRGQVAVDLTAKVSIPGGKRLGTRFDTIPDVPITKFTLRIPAGGNSPLGIVTNLCSAKARRSTASVAFRGQNGKLVKVSQRLHINGCPKASKAARKR